ncbi:DinB family protein [candidate division KSB1 bacterium]|nr:DinB family protein [candidate division KSB1 bacterium]
MKNKSSATTSHAASLRNRKEPVDLGRALVEAFMTNERINQVLLDLLDPKIWREYPPCSKRRNIATTFAHIHNVRRMRLVMSDKDKTPPPKLDRAEVTIEEVREALAHSAKAMVRLIERSLATGGHVYNHRPDVVALVCAAITHEAHHRGQICHWARELGAPITPEHQLKLWEWDKRWKEVGGNS